MNDHDHEPRSDPDAPHKKSDRAAGKGAAYLRFAAMILTAMVVMYWTMFAASWEWSHIRFSQSRVFMTLTMGGTMVLIMLAWMLNMYRNVKANVAVVTIGVLLIAGGVTLDRSQVTVDDDAFLNAMIPHHSMAITRSERAQIEDARVCRLAVDIIEAQKREILEMHWLIDDIRANGTATTAAEAAARQVPEFPVEADRSCGADTGESTESGEFSEPAEK